MDFPFLSPVIFPTLYVATINYRKRRKRCYIYKYPNYILKIDNRVINLFRLYLSLNSLLLENLEKDPHGDVYKSVYI